MKLLTRALAVALLAAACDPAGPKLASPAKTGAAPKRTDVYHVFFVKAALGKAKELQDWLKEPDPKHPDPKGIVLRHQDGDSWDYVAIEHIGTKATVEMGGTPMTPPQRALDANGMTTLLSPARLGGICESDGARWRCREDNRLGLCRFGLSGRCRVIAMNWRKC